MKIAISQPSYLPWLRYVDPLQAYASVLDLIFNEGERSLEILRGGGRDPFSTLQVREQVQARRQAS